MSFAGRPIFIVCAVAYFVLVLGIGIWASRRTRNVDDFFVAGRRLGLVVTAFATMSAAFSGFVFLGGPGYTYANGVATLFICLPVGFTAALLCWVLAKRIWLLGTVRGICTIPEAIDARFRSKGAAGLAAVAIVVGTLAYLGAQFRALAILIETIFGTEELFGAGSLPLAMALGLGIVLAYAVGGGMIAGAYTDLFQGALMCGVALAVFGYSMHHGGGPAGITTSIIEGFDGGERFLDPLGNVPVATALGFFFVFSVGTLGQPHMLHKFYMLDDPRKLKWMPAVIGGSQSLCILIWLGIGLAVPALVAEGRLAPLAFADRAAPAFLSGFVPDVLGGLAFAGVIAAIMSTADSFVNIGAAALVRDLPRCFGKPLERELYWARFAVSGLAVAAALFSLAYGDLIAKLGTFAFGTFAAALAPALAVGLNARWVTTRAAVASIGVGCLSSVLFEAMRRFELGWSELPILEGALPAAVAVALSFFVLCAVSMLDRTEQQIDADVAELMKL